VLGESGTTLVLDMGTPVRITELARHMISRSGRDIEIKFTGLRPGEKLHERLEALNESLSPTTNTHISSTRVNPEWQVPANF